MWPQQQTSPGFRGQDRPLPVPRGCTGAHSRQRGTAQLTCWWASRPRGQPLSFSVSVASNLILSSARKCSFHPLIHTAPCSAGSPGMGSCGPGPRARGRDTLWCHQKRTRTASSPGGPLLVGNANGPLGGPSSRALSALRAGSGCRPAGGAGGHISEARSRCLVPGAPGVVGFTLTPSPSAPSGLPC